MVLLIRGLLWIVVLVAVTTCSFTVKLGDRTTAQHIRRIWSTPETQDLVREAQEKAGPVVDRVKRGVEAGVREAAERDAGPAATAGAKDGADGADGAKDTRRGGPDDAADDAARRVGGGATGATRRAREGAAEAADAAASEARRRTERALKPDR